MADVMPIPSPEHWMFKAFDDLRTDMREQHNRQTMALNGLAETIRQELKSKSESVSELEMRVTIIETERREEEKQAIRRGTWAGIVAAAGLTAAIDGVKWLLHR